MVNYNRKMDDILPYSRKGIYAYNGEFDMDKVFKKADNMIDEKVGEVSRKIFGNISTMTIFSEGLKKGEKLRVVFSPEVQSKLTSGEYKVMNSVKGIKAVAVDQKGSIRELGSLQYDKVAKGIDGVQLANAMQMMAIQQQMREIKTELKEIALSLNAIEKGLHNDRIAKYYSAELLYEEAMVTCNEKLKSELLIECLSKLNDGIAEMSLELQSNIRELCDYHRKKGGKAGETSNQLIKMINQLFVVVHKASALKTAIYYEQGEYDALILNLVKYKSLIEKALPDTHTVNILYLYDKEEKKLNSIWSERAQKLPKMIDMAISRMQNPANLFLEMNMEGGLLR